MMPGPPMRHWCLKQFHQIQSFWSAHGMFTIHMSQICWSTPVSQSVNNDSFTILGDAKCDQTVETKERKFGGNRSPLILRCSWQVFARALAHIFHTTNNTSIEAPRHRDLISAIKIDAIWNQFAWDFDANKFFLWPKSPKFQSLLWSTLVRSEICILFCNELKYKKFHFIDACISYLLRWCCKDRIKCISMSVRTLLVLPLCQNRLPFWKHGTFQDSHGV